ncbi:hypothetical protein C7N83_12720 [Neisseria iguanae]|uniref:FdhE N-terminal domain-containing protein n=1 Tax=Neisseria iguanae TaxID=90242 RepID=A0A2P7TXG4_9NEIS|nr:hypothetical protein C7N83_12720 [Neisseria iguanae]
MPEVATVDVVSEFFKVFNDILKEINGKITATAAIEVSKLKALSQQQARALAHCVLTQATETQDQSAEIRVQAALQVIWTAWALQLTNEHVPPT